MTGGGNDAASAIIAAAYALAGTPAAGSYPASYLYAHTGQVNDITYRVGRHLRARPAYFCTAGPGYDGPTGVGTPASAAALGATAPDKSLPVSPAMYDLANGSMEVRPTDRIPGQDSLTAGRHPAAGPAGGTWAASSPTH